MTRRATLRGAERTPLTGDAARADVLICGASFAGLAVARELAGTGARVRMIDRYEIGERQTSACAAPTEWLERLGLGNSIRQTFRDLVIHTPRGTGSPGAGRASTTGRSARSSGSSATRASRSPRSKTGAATRCTPTAETSGHR